jgi:hypothetical protein
MGSVFYSGVLKQSDARNVDAKYFYVAARCWATGRSPYERATYEAVFRSEFGSPPAAQFVAYLPTLMLVTLIMAPFEWPVAANIFAWLNFAAAMLLFWACYRLVRESIGTRLQPVHWFWVVIAATIGGISGTILTGQTSVFVAAAGALALVGARLQRTWLTVVGLVVASAKPHVSGPIILCIALFEPRQRKAVLIAAVIAALVCGYAALVDSNLISSYLGSVVTYKSLATNDPAGQVGLVSLFLRIGVSTQFAQVCGLGGLLAVLGLVALLLRRYPIERLSESSTAMMLVTFSVGLARPIQGYDLCAYAVGIALLATKEMYFQAALLIPALLVWRPGLLQKLSMLAPDNQVATIAWLALLMGCIVTMRGTIKRDAYLGGEIL